MSRPHRDSRGYYRALGVSPQASAEEIRLAYEMVRGNEEYHAEHGGPFERIDKAWMVLKTPARRRQYDEAETTNRYTKNMRFRPKIRLDDPRLLAVCVALLLGVFTFVWVPLYGSRFRNFAPGDQLVDRGGKPFGAVVRTEERHAFPAGIVGEAYLVELASTRELRWYPANDIRALCRKPPS